MSTLTRRTTCIALGLSLTPFASCAQSGDINTTVNATLLGVEVPFPLTASLMAVAASGEISLTLRIALDGMITKLDQIIGAAGLDRPPGNFQSFNHNGTIASVVGDQLWAKYHFRVDPHNTQPTNGSVEIWLLPVVAPTGLQLSAPRAKLNISNDIAREVIQLIRLDRQLMEKLLTTVNGFLASPEARLQVPPELAGSHTVLQSARFLKEGEKNFLIVTGQTRLSSELLISLYRRFGMFK